MQYNDFELRAWQTGDEEIQVLVHSSPAGDMPRPITVTVAPETQASIRQQSSMLRYDQFEHSDQVVAIGRELAAMLLPLPVFTLLQRSQERVGGEQGLRLRLCLDHRLMDYPWEWLYRPDRTDAALDGFLALDPQLSLVRGAPMRPLVDAEVTLDAQRLLFAGAFYQSEQSDDAWGVRREYDELLELLEPTSDLFVPEFVSAAGDNIEQALAEPAPFFHYSGHSDFYHGRAYILKSIERPMNQDPLYCEPLGIMLRRAKTRLAVLMACNSGSWAVARPLLAQGLPVLVGARGIVTNLEANAFSQRLYNYLVAGLSLDEAVYDARVDLLDLPLLSQAPATALARFTVYMPSKDGVLIPRPDDPQTAARQRQVKNINIQVTQTIGTLHSGTVKGIDIRSLDGLFDHE